MDGFDLFFWRKAWMDLNCLFFWRKAWMDLNCFLEKGMDGFEGFLEKSIDGFELFFGEKHGWI